MTLTQQINLKATTPQFKALLEGYLQARDLPPTPNFTCSPDDIAIGIEKNHQKRIVGILQGRDFVREFPFTNQIKLTEMKIGFNWRVFEYIQNLYDRIVFVDNQAQDLRYITKQDIDILDLKDKRISEDGDEQWEMDFDLLTPLTYEKVKKHYLPKEIII